MELTDARIGEGTGKALVGRTHWVRVNRMGRAVGWASLWRWTCGKTL